MKETYDGTCLDWEIESAIKEYLEPFLNEISDLVEFKVTSQIQHFTELTNVQPVEQNNARHISASKLPNFINSAEWNFASTDTDLPSIQFVIYVASEKLGPLYLLSPNDGVIKHFWHSILGKPSANNGFLLPQWGGVVIHNPVTKNKQDPEHKSSHNNQLLGTQENFELAQPHLKNSYAQITYPSNTKSSDTGGYAQVNYVGLDFWEHLFLKNKYTVENTASAISTLNALYRLTTSMTDMVIRDEIKEAVELSLQNLAVPNLEFINSVMAAQYANFAFFHDTMVSMLYFPTEHKYAMYLPYFLPITLPVLAAIANYIARRKQKHKKQSAVENQEEKLKSE
ncbi:GPI transamidase component PIG-S [Zancudomyces culisetae]|uniref:GPI transamidase component PIG-S n=1 Tax=Zancudomyces culisetae TaxID=1213189 RepID=A0A1R1PNY6_ZANCU|nr:GPI transamidase component PIG-S [Zancudomyces culisetae]|eukprot:OMH82592.1 GPI transamidase component PIG-S [Zancudomyces culisetae]